MHPVRSCHRTIFTDVANDYHPYRQEKTQIYLPAIRIMITWTLKAHKQTSTCARAHIFAEKADKPVNGSTLRLISLGDTNEKQTVRCVFDKQRIFIRKRENIESTIVVHYISSRIKKSCLMHHLYHSQTKCLLIWLSLESIRRKAKYYLETYKTISYYTHSVNRKSKLYEPIFKYYFYNYPFIILKILFEILSALGRDIQDT